MTASHNLSQHCNNNFSAEYETSKMMRYFDNFRLQFRGGDFDELDGVKMRQGKSELFSKFIYANMKMKVCTKYLPVTQYPKRLGDVSFASRRSEIPTIDDADNTVESLLEIDHLKLPNDSNATCHCGVDKTGHDYLDIEQAKLHEKWTVQTAIKSFPTDAHGKIRFVSNSNNYFPKPVNYIRMADDTDANLICEIMENPNYWDLMSTKRPSFVVSVIGTAVMSDTFKQEVLNYGLMKAIQATHGWVLTDGLHSGLSKAIGIAVRDTQTLQWRRGKGLKRTLHCIGIAPWGCLKDRNDTLRCIDAPKTLSECETEREKLRTFLRGRETTIYPSHRRSNQSKDRLDNSNKLSNLTLDPNHSRFILVDDGYREVTKCFDNIAEFRAKLENAIAAPRTDYPDSSHGLEIPVIRLLIQGSEYSIDDVLAGLRYGIPLVIVDLSGFLANLLVFGLKKYDDFVADGKLDDGEIPDLNSTILERAILLFGDKAATGLVHKTIECFQYRDLITIFNHTAGKDDLDYALLTVLLQTKGNFNAQLQLALLCDRADLARTEIFNTVNSDWHIEELNEFMYSALVDNKLDFVKLFIDIGFDFPEFLTVDRLRQLYNDSVTEKSFLRDVFSKQVRHAMRKRPLLLSDISRAIRRYSRRFFVERYSNDTAVNILTPEQDAQTPEKKSPRFALPFQELFIWSVLLNRREMAMYLWEQCEKPLIAALVGSLLCRMVYHEGGCRHNSDLFHILKQAKLDYEQLAVDLINKEYATNPELAMLSLQRPEARWGGMDAMAIAAISSCKQFLGTFPCQEVIMREWKNGFHNMDTNFLVLFFRLWFIFPVCWLTHYKLDYSDSVCESCGLEKDECVCSCKSLCTKGLDRAMTFAGTGTSHNRSFKSRLRRYETQKSDLGPGTIDLVYLSNKIGNWKKLQLFYESPIAKATIYVTFLVAFYLLYSYVILFSFRWRVTKAEIVLYAVKLGFLLEEIRITATFPGETPLKKLKDWWSFGSLRIWNQLYIIPLVLSIISFVLRWFEQTFHAAKIILSINFIMYMFRIFKVYMINRYLGPKVVMIKRMSFDMGMFLVVVIVFFACYAISSQALMYPHREFYPLIFWDLFTQGIWELFGELNDVTTQGIMPYCDVNATANPVECETATWPVPLLLAVYLFFGNILMINMLIATFTTTYEQVQSNASEIWKYQMYWLIKDYASKPILPSPFNILVIIFRILRYIFRGFKHMNRKQPKLMDDQEVEVLTVFERVCRSDLMHQKRRQDMDTPIAMMNELTDKMNLLDEQLQNIELGLKRGQYKTKMMHDGSEPSSSVPGSRSQSATRSPPKRRKGASHPKVTVTPTR